MSYHIKYYFLHEHQSSEVSLSFDSTTIINTKYQLKKCVICHKIMYIIQVHLLVLLFLILYVIVAIGMVYSVLLLLLGMGMVDMLYVKLVSLILHLIYTTKTFRILQLQLLLITQQPILIQIQIQLLRVLLVISGLVKPMLLMTYLNSGIIQSCM